MANPGTPPPVATPPTVSRWGSLRPWGALVFVMFLLTSAVGGSLALENSYLLVTLASHIGLALVTLGIAGYAASRIGVRYRPLPRAFAGLAAFSALVGTVAGTVYLLAGMSDLALDVMEGFAVLGILCGLGMIAVGSASAMRPTAPA